MHRMLRKLFVRLLLPLLMLAGCTHAPAPAATPSPTAAPTAVTTAAPTASPSAVSEAVPDEHGVYDSKDDVALYLHVYGHLPDNFMTKKEARKKGWEGGALNRTIKGMCIGGDEYSNFEGTLPEADDRIYYECDIGTLHAKKRGAKRIVWSNDGLIYYTNDHYDTFELLYGEE